MKKKLYSFRERLDILRFPIADDCLYRTKASGRK